ncbi:MAG TPA: hypothetical protein VEP90_30130, partial [Methylomirabilota bacterium]|nr:hypothetical protein [Methylomirabilota bacterium]
PPCQLHRATRLRSHPWHFASTAPFTSHHLSRSKCEGVPPSPTAQVCRFAQTEHLSDRFITWAARIIHRRRSFLLSINTCLNKIINDLYEELNMDRRLLQFHFIYSYREAIS